MLHNWRKMELDRYDRRKTIRGGKTLKDGGKGSVQEKQHVRRPWGRGEVGLR